MLASSTHRDLASDLQAMVFKLRAQLETALDEAWADRDLILDGVESSGGMGLGGNAAPARELVRPTVAAWVGLGRLIQ